MAHQPLAYLYPEFLESAEARPIRILAEYLEPLRRFREQKIQDTVVFFGSARILPKQEAEMALDDVKKALLDDAEPNEELSAKLRRAERFCRLAEPGSERHILQPEREQRVCDAGGRARDGELRRPIGHLPVILKGWHRPSSATTAS